MKSNIFKPLLLLLAAASFINVQAQGPPIYTGTPILLGLDGGGVRTFGKYISKENASAYVQPFVVPYNLMTKFQIGGVLPFVSKSLEGLDRKSGIGDVAVFAKYLLWQKDGPGKTFRLLGSIKETFPTGNTDEMPALGSNAFQTQIGLTAGYVTTKFGLYGDLGYNITSNNLPDNLIYNLALGVPLLPQKYPPKQLNLFLEFTGSYDTDNQRNNLFIAPGVQLIVGRRVLFESGIQLPIIQNVPEGQRTNFIFLFGTRILIF